MIGFLSPWALAALPLAALPLVLHLIQRRDPPTVEFPAVRYLVQVTQEHQRRLRLRHWLLLLVRTLLILAVVFAAAGPSAPLRQAPSHSPSALVVVLDDSPSSGATAAGTPRLTELRAAAGWIFDRATPSDALWLLTADGTARRGTAETLRRAVDSLQPSSRRMDLGAALGLAEQVLATDSRPGAIAVLSDLQQSALSPARVTAPVVVARPGDPPPPNQGVTSLDPGPQPWSPEGGSVTVRLDGDSGPAAPVSVALAERPARQALVPARGAGSFVLGTALPGWWTVRASKAADEFRADDDRVALVRVAPVARVTWDPADRYVNAACLVLEQSGRIRRGGEIVVGSLGPGASIVLPPPDPAALGALNRALERRGLRWRFGAPVGVPGVSDSGPLLGRVSITRRYALTAAGASAASGVVLTTGGNPWLVRDGNIVLLGSRLDPAWTALPLETGFMRLMDAMVNRLARGQVATLEGAPGDGLLLPDLTTAVTRGERRWPVEGGAAFHPPEPGIYFLLAQRDTLGGLAVNLDPRESLLAPADPEAVRAIWPGARVVPLRQIAGAAFAGAGRASLQGPLLWLALALGLTEVGLASGVRRAR